MAATSSAASVYMPSQRTPQVYVYAVVDISISMKGTRIKEVCHSLSQIIEKCPDDVMFYVTSFSRTAHKITATTKSQINARRLVQEIEGSCGRETGTALYDAWGDMLSEIPYEVLQHDEVQIFVLSDGEDNASQRYTLDSVRRLLSARLSARTKFTFVEIGKGGNAQVTQALRQIRSTTQHVQTLSVDATAGGIKTAMDTVERDIMSTARQRTRTPRGLAQEPMLTTSRPVSKVTTVQSGVYTPGRTRMNDNESTKSLVHEMLTTSRRPEKSVPATSRPTLDSQRFPKSKTSNTDLFNSFKLQ